MKTEQSRNRDLPAPKTYRAIVERDGHGWRVRIHGVGGPAGVHARDLSDVEPRVRKLIWSYTGTHPADIDLDVEIRLPPAIQLRLDLAEQLCCESSTEMDGAIDDMVAANFPVSDINRILWTRCRMPRRFMISNDEVLRYGLEPFPDALGLRWDDHGRFMTVTCRHCVEATRKSYVDVPPDGQNVIVYEGPLVCDCCEEEYRACEERTP